MAGAHEPSSKDAIRVFVTASAHHNGIPVEALLQTGLWQAINPRSTKKKVSFGIINQNDQGFNEGRMMPPIAICTYDASSRLWKVKLLSLSDPVTLTVNGDNLLVVEE